MTVPLPDCLNDFAELDPLPKGMSSTNRGNSFLIQPGDRHHASGSIIDVLFRGSGRSGRQKTCGSGGATTRLAREGV